MSTEEIALLREGLAVQQQILNANIHYYLVAYISIFISIISLAIIFYSASHSLATLKEMKKQSKISIDISKEELRSYLCPEETEITINRNIKNVEVKVIFKYKNVGKTPIYTLGKFTNGIIYKPTNKEIESNKVIEKINISEITEFIPPNGIVGHIFRRQYSLNDFSDIELGTLVTTFTGIVKYKNVLERLGIHIRAQI